jgi:hypothetical protein
MEKLSHVGPRRVRYMLHENWWSDATRACVQDK